MKNIFFLLLLPVVACDPRGVANFTKQVGSPCTAPLECVGNSYCEKGVCVANTSIVAVPELTETICTKITSIDIDHASKSYYVRCMNGYSSDAIKNRCLCETKAFAYNLSLISCEENIRDSKTVVEPTAQQIADCY